MNTTYYKRWGYLMRTTFYQKNLRHWYESGFDKISKLVGQQNPFDKTNFTALLSGCHGEKTAETFINFILSQNPQAIIIILDINPVSIEQCKKVLLPKFPDKNLQFLCKDILDSTIPDTSVDYIETDGFLQFFEPDTRLPKLVHAWIKMLKPNGYITTRAIATTNIFTSLLIRGLYSIFCPIFSIPAYHQTLKEIINVFEQYECKVEHENTWIPTYRQFTMINMISTGSNQMKTIQ